MTPKKLSGILLLITMLALLVTSCRKSSGKPLDPSPVPVPGKLSKLEFNDGTYDSIYYHNDGTIYQVKTYYKVPQPFTEVFTFEYDIDKRVVRITTNTLEKYEYKYIANQLVSVQHYMGTQKVDYRLYDYVDGRLTEMEEYYQFAPNSPGYELTARRVYTYYADGNLKAEDAYSFDAVTHAPRKDMTIERQDYDSHLNPSDIYERFLYLSFVKMAKNNARKLVATQVATGAQTQYNFSYTYDAGANPLTRTVTYMSGGQQQSETTRYYYY